MGEVIELERVLDAAVEIVAVLGELCSRPWSAVDSREVEQ